MEKIRVQMPDQNTEIGAWSHFDGEKPCDPLGHYMMASGIYDEVLDIKNQDTWEQYSTEEFVSHEVDVIYSLGEKIAKYGYTLEEAMWYIEEVTRWTLMAETQEELREAFIDFARTFPKAFDLIESKEGKIDNSRLGKIQLKTFPSSN